jgi:muramoyltetrapeptide carboxypeptidase
MEIRYPKPLASGDRIGVTSPSTGISDRHRARLGFCVDWLRRREYDVVIGNCMDGSTVTSAPASERADELTAMLTDPTIAAVVPPWGGELAVELLPHLDFDVIAAAAPTWVVGYSDISTILLPLTLLTGVATIHGHNLMDTPYRLPDTVRHWLDVAALEAGSTLNQQAISVHRSAEAGFDNYEQRPTITEYTLDGPDSSWQPLDPHVGDVDIMGRLIGGCIETISPLAGTRYGDLHSFAADYASEDGLIVYVEASEEPALNIARDLWAMRLAGWFEDARGVLVGRTHAPDSEAFTQLDAVRSSLGDLRIPIVLDVDCGHVVPHLALVNGAVTHVTISGPHATIEQRLR